jgi:hypothetical protein
MIEQRGDALSQYVQGKPYTSIEEVRLAEDAPRPKHFGIIGLIGKMHSGKTTIADTLDHERDWVVRYFAEPVKQLSAAMVNEMAFRVAAMIGVRANDLGALDLNADKTRFRPLFQFVGSYGRHVFGEDVWIKVFESRYRRQTGHPGYPSQMVVADVRYPNEAKYLLDQGFDLYLVKRPEKARIQSVKEDFLANRGRLPKKKELKSILNHESEKGVDDIESQGLYTAIIDNAANISDLQAVARGLN